MNKLTIELLMNMTTTFNCWNLKIVYESTNTNFMFHYSTFFLETDYNNLMRMYGKYEIKSIYLDDFNKTVIFTVDR